MKLFRSKKFYVLFLIMLFVSCSFALVGCSKNGQPDISFAQGITLSADSIYTEVDNDVDTFTFNGKVNTKSGFSFSIYKDKEGLKEIPTNTLDLNIGDNIYYLLLKDNNNNKKLYNINVRRLPMYTISLYIHDEYKESIGTRPKELYKTLSVQENSKLNLSNEKPTRTGYDFASWNYSVNEIVTGNKDIFAEWEAHRHFVYVDSKKYESVYGEYLTLPIPDRPSNLSEYYTFRGYNIEEAGYYTFDSLGRYVSTANFEPVRFYVDKDITVSAIWRRGY